VIRIQREEKDWEEIPRKAEKVKAKIVLPKRK
jgi:hypothetical protein